MPPLLRFNRTDLTTMPDRIRLAKIAGDAMATHTCHDCDSPGDGICSACHGAGEMVGNFNASGDAPSCPVCHGTGECRSCGGVGEIEVGGEGD